MKLGVLTVALGDMSLDAACKFLSEQGVQMVEIGCGAGTLTYELSQTAKRVVGYEIDRVFRHNSQIWLGDQCTECTRECSPS